MNNLPWLSYGHLVNVDIIIIILIPIIFDSILYTFLLIGLTLTRMIIALGLAHVTLDHLLVFILPFLLLMKRVSGCTQVTEMSSTVIWFHHHVLLAWVWNVDVSACVLVFYIILSIIIIASSCGLYSIMMTSMTERILVTHVQVILGSCFLSLIQ